MTACENIDGHCGASWCDCEYQRKKQQSLRSGDLLGVMVELLKTLEAQTAADKQELRKRKKAIKINLRLKEALEYHLGITPDYEI